MYFLNLFFKSFFFLSLFLSIFYIFSIQTEKFESESVIMIKDLSPNQSISPLGSFLLPSGSEAMVEARLLEIYAQSFDMFVILDKKFNLKEYYTGMDIDFLHRLSTHSFLPSLLINNENILLQYNNDLSIVYDEVSTTISISFSHARTKIAQEIVKSIIDESARVLNLFENQNSEVIFSFLKNQKIEKHQLFIESLEELLLFQNENSTIDPKIDIEIKNKILAGLEADLIQKNIEYNIKAQYLNISTAEMQLIKTNINYIETSILKIKKKITGNTEKDQLNVNVSEFTLLRSKLEFNKKLYMQTLVKFEETKVLIKQNTKNLIIIIEPSRADSYTYPNKIKDTLSILIIFVFIYTVLSLIFTIISDHKD